MDNFTATPQLAKKLSKTLGKLFINNTCHFKPKIKINDEIIIPSL